MSSETLNPSTEIATGGTTAVGPAMSQEELDELFGGAGTIRPKLSWAKVDHQQGCFLVPDEAGNFEEHARLEDVVLVGVQAGRVMWDPDMPPASGVYVCRSPNNVTPDPTGQFEGPCATCPNAQWGERPKDKSKQAKKPLCDKTQSLLFRRQDGTYFVLKASRSSLGPTEAFISRAFLTRKLPYFMRFVTVWLKEEEFAGRPYFVLQFALGEATPLEIVAEAKASYRAYKEVMATTLAEEEGLGAEPASAEAEPARPEPARPQAEHAGQTVEIEASPPTTRPTDPRPAEPRQTESKPAEMRGAGTQPTTPPPPSQPQQTSARKGKTVF